MNIFRIFTGDLRSLLLILTILCVPIIVIYGTGDKINYNQEVESKFGKLTIANLGYDSVHCTMIPFGLKKFNLTCPYGSISKLEPDNFGINSYIQKVRDSCRLNETKFNNSMC